MHFQSHPAHHGYYCALAKACAQAVVVASQATGDWLCQSAPGQLSGKLHALRAGVEAERFHPRVSGASVRAELGLAECYPVLVTVGSLEARKGHLDLVNAAAFVRRTYPHVRLLIAGEELEPGTFRRVLSEHIAGLGMDGHVEILGRRDDVPELLAATDLFLLGSLKDPYPNVVLEAMAAGLPVVATRSGGSTEIVVEGQTGLLVDPGDPEGLAEAIRSVVADPNTLQAMGSAGRARIEREGSWKAFARSMEGVYRLVSESRAIG
jgi:glycosyltransferase involved in cell wall biosynthesis